MFCCKATKTIESPPLRGRSPSPPPQRTAPAESAPMRNDSAVMRGDQAAMRGESALPGSSAGTHSIGQPVELYPRDIQAEFGFIANDVRTNSQNRFPLFTHHFIKSPDGNIRRFPEDHGSQIPMRREAGALYRGRTLLRARAAIYDAPVKARGRVTAEYRLDAAKRRMMYAVNGQSTAPVSNGNTAHAFPLGNGKWMIPQLDMRGCTYSCEAMLAAEGKSASEVAEQLRNVSLAEERSRRDTPDIIASVRKTTGREPILQQFTGTSAEVTKNIKAATESHGAGILLGSGHSRMIDGVAEQNGKPYFKIRDPFHGTQLEVKDHEEFWDQGPGRTVSKTAAAKPRSVDILFLSDKPAAIQPQKSMDRSFSQESYLEW